MHFLKRTTKCGAVWERMNDFEHTHTHDFFCSVSLALRSPFLPLSRLPLARSLSCLPLSLSLPLTHKHAKTFFILFSLALSFWLPCTQQGRHRNKSCNLRLHYVCCWRLHSVRFFFPRMNRHRKKSTLTQSTLGVLRIDKELTCFVSCVQHRTLKNDLKKKNHTVINQNRDKPGSVLLATTPCSFLGFWAICCKVLHTVFLFNLHDQTTVLSPLHLLLHILLHAFRD